MANKDFSSLRKFKMSLASVVAIFALWQLLTVWCAQLIVLSFYHFIIPLLSLLL